VRNCATVAISRALKLAVTLMALFERAGITS
jgi:hypothetical protein